MEDLKSLERFLRTEEEKSHRSQLGTAVEEPPNLTLIAVSLLYAPGMK